MGFCFLGIGSCSGDTQKQINRTSADRESFSDKMTSTVNDVARNITATATNLLNIDIKGKNTYVSGLHIDQSISVDQNVQMDISDQLSTDEFIDNVVDYIGEQAAQNKMDDSGGNAIFDKTNHQYTESEQSMLDIVRDKVTTTVTNTDMMNIVANASNIQNYTQGEEGGTAKFIDSTFNQVADIISNDIINAYYNAITSIVLPSSVQDRLDQETDDDQQQSGGVTAMIENFGIIVIVVLVIIIILTILYKLATRKSIAQPQPVNSRAPRKTRLKAKTPTVTKRKRKTKTKKSRSK